MVHGIFPKIPDHLTFEVLNLFPDYDYPGKIKSLDVKVTGAPDEDKVVTVDIELQHLDGFEDGAMHALTRITSPVFIDNGEKKTQFYDMWLYQVDGDEHHLRGEIHISKYSKSGYWTAGDIVITDLQGNQRFEGRNDCVWNCYVNNPEEDVESPKYVKNSLNYEVTDTIVEGHQAQNLRVTCKVTDNVKIDRVMARLSYGNDGYSFGDNYGIYDEESQTVTFNYLITEYFRTADYYVTYLCIYDNAQTVNDIYFSESPSHEPVKKIHITTPNPDTQVPQVDLNRITVYAEPTHPEAPDGETLVTINYYARDDKSGLGHVLYRLKDPQGILHTEWHYHKNHYTEYFDGDPTVWERYTIKCVLPKGSAPGIWGLAEMEMADKAWNVKTYNFVETVIFEPDDSNTDYVLFSEMNDDNTLDIKVISDTTDNYGYTYRVIQEETGMEISGRYTPVVTETRAASLASMKVDVSSLPDGKLIIIVNVTDNEGKIVSVKSSTIEKRSLYQLTYMVDGTEYKTVDVRYGDSVTSEPKPTKDGYAFSGWSEIPSNMPAHDVTVTGSFPNLLGDAADKDGDIAVNDYEQLVRICLEKVTMPVFGTLDFNIADVNNDNNINVGDIAEVVNLINEMPYNSAMRLPAVRSDEHTDMYSLREVWNGEKRKIVIELHNSKDYVAGQMDIQLPEGVTLKKESLGNHVVSHTLYSNDLTNGKHRVIISSLQNAALCNEEDKVILRMEISDDVKLEDIKVTNAMFTDKDARVYYLDGYVGETTFIDEINTDFETIGEIYSLDGKKQNRFQEGVNIIRYKNGNVRKIIVK